MTNKAGDDDQEIEKVQISGIISPEQFEAYARDLEQIELEASKEQKQGPRKGGEQRVTQ